MELLHRRVVLFSWTGEQISTSLSDFSDMCDLCDLGDM